jgi:hypothetical protein
VNYGSATAGASRPCHVALAPSPRCPRPTVSKSNDLVATTSRLAQSRRHHHDARASLYRRLAFIGHPSRLPLRLDALRGLPAERAVVAMYLTDLADSGDFKASTLSRRLVSIAQAHNGPVGECRRTCWRGGSRPHQGQRFPGS